MPKMHLRQAGFEYSAYRPFTKNKDRTRNFKETGDSRYNYQNKLYKALFQYEILYRVLMDSPRRTASDELLREYAFDITKVPKYDRYQHRLASVIYNFLLKACLVVLLKITFCQTSVLWTQYTKICRRITEINY